MPGRPRASATCIEACCKHDSILTVTCLVHILCSGSGGLSNQLIPGCLEETKSILVCIVEPVAQIVTVAALE